MPPGWIVTGGRLLSVQLAEHPEWDDLFQNVDGREAIARHAGWQRFEEEHPGYCGGQIQSIHIRKGKKALPIVIGKMCLGCFAFWPTAGDYRKMKIERAQR